MIKTVTTFVKSIIRDKEEIGTEIVNLENVDINVQVVLLVYALASVLEDERCELEAGALDEVRELVEKACDNNAARSAKASAESTTSEATK